MKVGAVKQENSGIDGPVRKKITEASGRMQAVIRWSCGGRGYVPVRGDE
jgi:hypothetical protein